MPSIEAFLREMIERGASDLHLTTSSPPMIRLHGELLALAHPPLSGTDTKNLAYSLLTEAQKKKFEEESELDFSFGIKGVSRFRGNLYLQKGAVGGAFRMIPHQTPQLPDARAADVRARALQPAAAASSSSPAPPVAARAPRSPR
jgi:twitching motility protein PilT